MSEMFNDDFRRRVWEFYRSHGRNLPWRHSPTPYEVMVSEVMLQQTQVSRIVERYPRWLERFPDFASLAAVSVAEVVAEWQGLGYNRRALWLQRAAQLVMSEYDGELPQRPEELIKLPGVGPNTAGSIAAFAFNAPVVFIETNIRRVFIHEFFTDDVAVDDKQLLPLIEATLDRGDPCQWYYALMDYGADLAKRVPNPNRRSRHYTVQTKFEGSLRQLRGEVLWALLAGEPLPTDDERLPDVMAQLEREGFLRDGRLER